MHPDLVFDVLHLVLNQWAPEYYRRVVANHRAARVARQREYRSFYDAQHEVRLHRTYRSFHDDMGEVQWGRHETSDADFAAIQASQFPLEKTLRLIHSELHPLARAMYALRLVPHPPPDSNDALQRLYDAEDYVLNRRTDPDRRWPVPNTPEERLAQWVYRKWKRTTL